LHGDIDKEKARRAEIVVKVENGCFDAMPLNTLLRILVLLVARLWVHVVSYSQLYTLELNVHGQYAALASLGTCMSAGSKA